MNANMRTRVSRRRLLRASAMGAVGLTGAALIGCGDDDDEGSAAATGTAAPAATGTAAAAAPGTPIASGPLRLPASQDPVHLDPQLTILYQTAIFAGFTYSRLMRPAVGADIARAQFVAEPDLAMNWEQPDQVTYTFKLNPNAKWHNLEPVNGRGVVAEDVAYTMERNLDAETASDSAYIYSSFATREVVDDHTLRLTTGEPFAPQLLYLMGHHAWIIPREAVESFGDLTRNTVGSGPYILKSWDEGVGAEFERNPEWAGARTEGAPYFSGVEYPMIPDASARLARFLAGQFDAMSIRPENVAEAEDSGAIVVEEPGTGDSHVTFGRLTTPPWNDPRVRRALGFLVDRHQIAELVYGGHALPKGPIAPGFSDWALPQEEVEELLGKDLDKAQKLIDATGMKWDDLTLTIDVTPRYGTTYVQMAQIVSAAWQEMGVNVDIRQNEYAAQIKKWQTADSDAILNPQTQFLEADEFLSFYHTDGNRNWTNFSDPEIDSMVEKQRVLVDVDERNELVRDIQRKLVNEHLSTIPFVTGSVFTGRRPHLREYYDNIMYGYEGSWHGWHDQT